MGWWNNYEVISKVQTFITILLCVVSVAGVVIKLRCDHLKKASDRAKSAERARVEADLKAKTAELDDRTKPKPLKERLKACLHSIDENIIPGVVLGKTDFQTEMSTIKLDELKRLANEPEGGELISISVAPMLINPEIGNKWGPGPVVKVAIIIKPAFAK